MARDGVVRPFAFLAVLILSLLLTGCLPRPSRETVRVNHDWDRKVSAALTEYVATCKSDEQYLEQEQAKLLKAKDVDGMISLLAGYARQTQRVALKAMKEVDDAGEPPAKATRVMELLRRLLKSRISTARSCFDALREGDLDRFDDLAAKEAKELPPLQKELIAEVRRVMPESFASEGAAAKKHTEGLR